MSALRANRNLVRAAYNRAEATSSSWLLLLPIRRQRFKLAVCN